MLDRLRRRLARALYALGDRVDTGSRLTFTADTGPFDFWSNTETQLVHLGDDEVVKAARERAHEARRRFADDGGEYPCLDGR